MVATYNFGSVYTAYILRTGGIYMSLLIDPLWETVIVLRFVVRYFMSILVLQSS